MDRPFFCTQISLDWANNGSWECVMESEMTNYYHRQQKLSFAQFLAELPNFAALTASAILTGSLIIWLDFLDSLGNVLRTGIVSLITGRLSSRYNEGTARIENIATLFCDGIVMCGLILCTILSGYEILTPHRPSEFLIYVTALKVINVIFDAVFLREQGRIRKMNRGMLVQSNYSAAIGMLLFDAVELFSILLISFFRNSRWTWYFSPVISILIACYLAHQCVRRLRSTIRALSNQVN